MKSETTIRNKDAMMRGAAAIAHILQKEGVELLVLAELNQTPVMTTLNGKSS